MEQIETQASDLRFLAQAQVSLSSSSSGVSYEAATLGLVAGAGRPQQQQQQQQQQRNDSPGSTPLGPGSATYTGAAAVAGESSASAGKRKSTADGSAKQTRSKRNRYISIACNECKRRKIKCNGESPCKRCGNMNLDCKYTQNCCGSTFKDSDEFKHVTTQLSSLRDELGSLKQAMHALQTQVDRPQLYSSVERPTMGPGMVAVAPSPAQSSVSGRHTSVSQAKTPGAYRGTTSTTHMLGLAQSKSGISYADPGDVNSVAPEPVMPPLRPGADPILEYPNEEMIRLCGVHESEIGIMYPVLDMETVKDHARNIAPHLDHCRREGLTQLMNDDKTLELKIVICCALVVEEHGPSARAQKLFDSMEATLNRKLLADEAYLSILPLLCIFAGYRFLTDDEGLAWRVIGQVCRLCLELGLHRSQVHEAIQDPMERRNALNCFWSAYVLDRRWAFNTGLPYVIQDADVDSKLPYPTSYPYLVAMITYSQLGAKVWSLVEQRRQSFQENNTKLWVQDIERLDAEIIQWYSQVPPEVQIRDWHDDGLVNTTSSYNLQRLKVWTYLRKNQIRNWLHAPILHTAESIMSAPHLAQVCVDVAKDTIAYLLYVNTNTDMIRKSRAFYSQFLTSALAIIFLASTQASAQFSSTCREDFHTGLQLIDDLSPRSHISKRLWRIVNSLRQYLNALGPRQSSEAHSNAALGMIGLARGGSGHVDANAAALYGYSMDGPPPMAPGGMEMESNGLRLQNEFGNIFEELASYNGGHRSVNFGEDLQMMEQMRFAAQDMFFGHMRHVF